MKKQIEEKNELEIKSLLTILIIVSAIVGLAYAFTIAFVVNRGMTYTETTNEKEIYAAETYSKKEATYYVLFLDMTDYANKKIYQDIFSKSTKTVYIVDLSRKVNDDFVTAGDINIKSITELKVKDKTLIKINNKKAELYKEGITEITKELK